MDPEVELDLTVELQPDTSLEASLFFLQVSAEGGPTTNIGGGVDININAGANPGELTFSEISDTAFADLIDLRLALEANVDLLLKGGTVDPNLPSITAELLVDWDFSADFGDPDPFRGSSFDASFGNYGIDLGGYAAKLLKLRGQAMQKAVPVGEGTMAALLGADEDLAAQAVAAGQTAGVCGIANDNAPGQIVISGATAAIEAAIAKAGELGLKKAMKLPVSAPFHCPMMQPAADAMAEALAAAKINAPAVPVVANVTARPTDDVETIRRQLVEQVTGRVRWRESVMWMVEEGGITTLAEAGAGKVLSTMLKLTTKDAKGQPLNSAADLEAFAAALKADA